TKDLDRDDVQDQINNKDDGDPGPGGNWCFPVVEEDGACGRFGGDEDGVRIPRPMASVGLSISFPCSQKKLTNNSSQR
ncbi:hypothetical protein OFB58_27895, partial [Escherichia coli]|nr:hypothetical protein [Escherichia coli]